jgi:hypothetical protein
VNLNQAFIDIESIGEHVDETRKLRILIQGITDPQLNTVKTQVLATAALKDTFEHAVNFIIQYIEDQHSLSGGNNRSTNTRNI